MEKEDTLKKIVSDMRIIGKQFPKTVNELDLLNFAQRIDDILVREEVNKNVRTNQVANLLG